MSTCWINKWVHNGFRDFKIESQFNNSSRNKKFSSLHQHLSSDCLDTRNASSYATHFLDHLYRKSQFQKLLFIQKYINISSTWFTSYKIFSSKCLTLLFLLHSIFLLFWFLFFFNFLVKSYIKFHFVVSASLFYFVKAKSKSEKCSLPFIWFHSQTNGWT